MSRRLAIGMASITVYIGAIVAANWLVAHVGLIRVWPGTVGGAVLLAPAGVYCAGLTFPARDMVQRSLGWVAGIAAILVGAGLSWLISPTLAVASGVTFLVSEGLDFAVYTPMQRRWFTPAVIVSSVAAAIVDSLLFLRLAHIPYTTVIAGQQVSILGGQIVGKLTVIALVGAPAAFALRRSRALAVA